MTAVIQGGEADLEQRKTIDVEKLVAALKSKGSNTTKLEAFLEEIKAERNNNPTTTNSEVIKNTYTA